MIYQVNVVRSIFSLNTEVKKKQLCIKTKPDFAAASQLGEVANEPRRSRYCPSSFSFNPINPVFRRAAVGLSQANECHVNTLNDFIDFIMKPWGRGGMRSLLAPVWKSK